MGLSLLIPFFLLQLNLEIFTKCVLGVLENVWRQGPSLYSISTCFPLALFIWMSCSLESCSKPGSRECWQWLMLFLLHSRDRKEKSSHLGLTPAKAVTQFPDVSCLVKTTKSAIWVPFSSSLPLELTGEDQRGNLLLSTISRFGYTCTRSCFTLGTTQS